MKKIILYGSPHCDSCGIAKEVLEKNDVKFGYIDVTGNMVNLKKYLKIRDHNESHVTVREEGRVGIPTLFVDNETYLITDAEDCEQLIDKLKLLEN